MSAVPDNTVESILTFHFKEPGSAEFQIEMKGITPGQLFAAAAYMQWLAQQEATRVSQSKIAIPR